MTEQKRTTRRYDLQLPVEFAAVGDAPEVWRSAETRNLSLGGLFAATSERLAFGTRVKLRLHLPGGRDPIETTATVRWVDDQGMGVQFEGLRAKDVWALGKFFEKA